jgi:hypothetical protein
MKTLPLFLASLFISAHASAACSVDDIREMARYMAMDKDIKIVEETQDRESGGRGNFIIYTDQDNGSIFAIRTMNYREMGKDDYRITFLNRNDFVVRIVEAQYDDHIVHDPDPKTNYAETRDYVFCGRQLQIPGNIRGTKREATYAEEGNGLQDLFLKAPELKEYISKIQN